MSLLVRRCLSRSHLLEEYVETWQIDHKEAMYARDLEELVTDCLELAALLRRAWDWTVERLFDEQEPSERVFAGEEIVRGTIRRTLKVYERTGRLIDDAEQKGYRVEGSQRFREAVADTGRLLRETDEQWPPMDSGRIGEAREAFKRGEYKSAEEMLHELQGGSAETD